MMDPVASAEIAQAAAVMSRRSFLRLAGAAAAAGLLPSGCGHLPADLLPGTDGSLAVLGPRSYATFTAAAMQIVGPAGAEMIADRRIDVGRGADRWLERTPASAGPIVQGLALLEFGVWPLLAKLRPFTSLSASAKDTVLKNLMDSHFDLKHALFQGVRSLSLLAFYSAPASRELSGYPGPFGNERVSIRSGMP